MEAVGLCCRKRKKKRTVLDVRHDASMPFGVCWFVFPCGIRSVSFFDSPHNYHGTRRFVRMTPCYMYNLHLSLYEKRPHEESALHVHNFHYWGVLLFLLSGRSVNVRKRRSPSVSSVVFERCADCSRKHASKMRGGSDIAAFL